MNRNPSPMIPPNFVTLRKLKELKEKREEEERLNREEEERVQKLKEKEEQEGIQMLKEKEDQNEYPKHRPKTLGSKKPYRGGFRRDARPKALPSGGARSFPYGEAKAGHELRPTSPRSTNLEAQLSRKGWSDIAAANGRSDAKPLTLDESKKKKKKKMAKGRRKKEGSKEREGEMTKMPLAHYGHTVPMIEEESEITKVTVDVNGLGRIKVSGGERCGPVKVIGSESVPIAEVEKRVSDLKMGGRNPNPYRGGRGRGHGGWGRGGARNGGSTGRGRGRDEGGMVWVKKTTES